MRKNTGLKGNYKETVVKIAYIIILMKNSVPNAKLYEFRYRKCWQTDTSVEGGQ